jgi:hypothetical protein
MKAPVSMSRWGVALTLSLLVHAVILGLLLAWPAAMPVPTVKPVIQAELLSIAVGDKNTPQDSDPSPLEAVRPEPAVQPPRPREPEPDVLLAPERARSDAPEEAPLVAEQTVGAPATELKHRVLDLSLPPLVSQSEEASLARLYQPSRATVERKLGAMPAPPGPARADIGMKRWAPTRFATVYRDLDARTPYQAFVAETPILGPLLGMFSAGPVTNPNCPIYMEPEDCESPFSNSLDDINRVPGTSAFWTNP